MEIGDIFRTTHKGIIPMQELQKTTLLSRNVFVFSLGLQIMLLLVFAGIFGQAIFRSVKKIKNPKFKNEKQDDESDDEDNFQDDNNVKETNDNLIYRFDEVDHQKQKKMQGEEEEDIKSQSAYEENSEDDEYNREHDEYEEVYLQIDHNLLFLQPFLIPHIIANCVFAADLLSIGMMAATLTLFFIFNIKGFLLNRRWASMLFMIPSFCGFLPLFYSNQKMN